MFVVNKKQLQSTYNNALKLVGKYSELVIDVQKEGLWLIINVDSYIKVFVPAQVEETGMFKIQQEVFESVFSLRGDNLKCSFNKEQNILNVTAGTKTSLYVSFKVNSEDYEEPEDEEDETNIKLKSKHIGDFKNNLDCVYFTSPDPNSHEYALLQNKENVLSLIFASTNLCTRYDFAKNLGKTEFELCIPVDKFKLALSMIESGLNIIVSEKRMMIKSDNLIVTLPSLLDNQFLGYIQSSEVLLKEGSLISGKLDLNVSEVQKVLNGVRSISQGTSVVDFKLKNTVLTLSLENKIGVAKDKCTINDNSIEDNIRFSIPELFIDAAFFMSSKINDKVSLRFGEGYRFFVIKTHKDNVDFLTLGPVSEG